MGFVLTRTDEGRDIAEYCSCRESESAFRLRVLRDHCGITSQEWDTRRFGLWDVHLHRTGPEQAQARAMFEAVSRWAAGDGLAWIVLSGAPGIGKTHLLIGAIRAVVIRAAQGERPAGWEYGGGVPPAFYLTWADFMAELRQAMSDGGDIGADGVLDRYSAIPCLAIDDIATEDMRTPYQRSTLMALVDRRYRRRSRTLFAINAPIGDMPDRVADRMRDSSLSVAMPLTLQSVRERLAPVDNSAANG